MNNVYLSKSKTKKPARAPLQTKKASFSGNSEGFIFKIARDLSKFFSSLYVLQIVLFCVLTAGLLLIVKDASAKTQNSTSSQTAEDKAQVKLLTNFNQTNDTVQNKKANILTLPAPKIEEKKVETKNSKKASTKKAAKTESANAKQSTAKADLEESLEKDLEESEKTTKNEKEVEAEIEETEIAEEELEEATAKTATDSKQQLKAKTSSQVSEEESETEAELEKESEESQEESETETEEATATEE